MSSWAWLSYHIDYSLTALKLPLSLTIWQHGYNLNALLVVQETADTLGLIFLLSLFLAAQILVRNTMFSIYALYERSLTVNPLSRNSSRNTQNFVKILTTNETSWYSVRQLFSSSCVYLRSFFSSK